jgi:hypothetical protein
LECKQTVIIEKSVNTGEYQNRILKMIKIRNFVHKSSLPIKYISIKQIRYREWVYKHKKLTLDIKVLIIDQCKHKYEMLLVVNYDKAASNWEQPNSK